MIKNWIYNGPKLDTLDNIDNRDKWTRGPVGTLASADLQLMIAPAVAAVVAKLGASASALDVADVEIEALKTTLLNGVDEIEKSAFINGVVFGVQTAQHATTVPTPASPPPTTAAGLTWAVDQKTTLTLVANDGSRLNIQALIEADIMTGHDTVHITAQTKGLHYMAGIGDNRLVQLKVKP